MLVSFLSDQSKSKLKRIGSLIKSPSWVRAEHFVYFESPVQSINLDNTKSNRYLADTLRYELTTTRIRRLLRYEDRNSMAFSVESRVPFLTIELVEFLLSLPSRYLVSSTAETKSVFRAAMRGIVPDEILDRRDKVGFDTPQHAWLKAQWGSIEPTLRDVPEDSLTNFEQAKRLIEKGLESDAMLPEIWRIINYRAWLRKNA
jgi:asparagine synthase (glutamine-hydrolysing)